MGVIGLGAALLYAPYLPRLLMEGYPKATWPAPGFYAAVLGGDRMAPPTTERNAIPNADPGRLFTEANGRAILAAHNGQLVMEHYAEGVSRETRLNSYSLVKSLIGALTLKAIAEGRIKDFEMPLGALLNEYYGGPTGGLPVCSLLDMRSGLAFEPGGKKAAPGFDVKDLEATKLNLAGPMARLHMGGLRSIQGRLVAAPKSNGFVRGCGDGEFSYQNVNTALLGEILERRYGRPLELILSEKIWAPAGAQAGEWRRYDERLPVTPYCCLFARPMDWLKVAQFLLDNGTAQSRFLPEPLWQRLMGLDLAPDVLQRGRYRDHVYHNVLDRPGERLQGPFAYFFGSRGQAVYIVPGARLAVVRFGDGIQKLHSTLYGVERSLRVGDTASR